MTTPNWITIPGSLGVVPNRQYFQKTLQANNAVSFALISGSLPAGTTLNSANGTISGVPLVSNYSSIKPISTSTFTVGAVGSTGNIANITLSLGVITNRLLNNQPYDQNRVVADGIRYSFQFQGGTVDTAVGRQWRLSNGTLPPNSSLSATGTLTVNFGTPIYPFTPDQFIRSDIDRSQASLRIEFWNSFIAQILNQPQSIDYQFTAELADNQGMVTTAHTVRIIHLKPSASLDWFQLNATNIVYDTSQWYYLLVSTLDDNITWRSGFALGSIENGGVSEKLVEADAVNGIGLTYSMKPQYFSILPQGLRLQSDGLIVGRASFRCYEDDPENVPVSNYYEFAVRAANSSYTSYADKLFSIDIQRIHTRPYDDVYIRSFPTYQERAFINSIFNDTRYFSTAYLYRPTDPNFGLNRDLRMLFSAGMTAKNQITYEQALLNNHSDKTLLLGDIRTAYNLDENLSVTYEVVYATVFDPLLGRDPVTQLPAGLPQTIDLRPFISNYYVQSGQSFYELRPNGLENMRKVLESTIGVANRAGIPTWMRCLQPTADPGIFLAPLGFLPCVVLAYTLPGKSTVIASQLREINFNQARYEFDRYQLGVGSTSYSVSANAFSVTSKTTFDNETTVFDLNSTRIVDNMDYYREPGEGDKYLKFPRTGVFK